jgi:hypothetical protein
MTARSTHTCRSLLQFNCFTMTRFVLMQMLEHSQELLLHWDSLTRSDFPMPQLSRSALLPSPSHSHGYFASFPVLRNRRYTCGAWDFLKSSHSVSCHVVFIATEAFSLTLLFLANISCLQMRVKFKCLVDMCVLAVFSSTVANDSMLCR